MMSQNQRSKKTKTDVLDSTTLTPIIPLKDVVIFPNMVVPLFIGREKSIQALDSAAKKDNLILLLTQKNATDNDITEHNIYHTGTLAKILQILKLPDGTNKVLIEGKIRASATNIVDNNSYLAANYTELATKNDLSKLELEATKRELLQKFTDYIKMNQKIPEEILSLIIKIDNLEQLSDVVTTHIVMELTVRQDILETTSLKKRLHKLLKELNREIEIINVEKKIQGRIKQQIEKNQKEYYLHEQAKAIQQELGEEEELNELDELEFKIKKTKMTKEAEEKALSELKKLKLMPFMSSESAIVRNYIDHLIELPWNKTSKININLEKAQTILDKDHYGLEKIKERIIEYLAVQKRVENNKAPILCFVGPPGVGKTSLGESIARATGRKYLRIALGGVHDEAEIRGHRKTYVGAMPGKILQNLIKADVKNPLFLLDEIDKLSFDNRGDPASALLEVLDPEQNKAFLDNYTEVSFDLSQVMFVATANSLNIPAPLRDRMEIIRLSGYTEQEKVNIAKQYLLPKQIKNNGLKSSELSVTTDAILNLIRYYTQEAGVRNLDRVISKLCRKTVILLDLNHLFNNKQTQNKTSKKVVAPKKNTVTVDNLKEFLGVEMYDFGVSSPNNRVGRVTGLAWTEVGGEILTIEVLAVPGKGQIIQTGHLGNVMKESIQAAISLVRNNAVTLGIDPKFYENIDIHVHVPEGATPKDGPSAGLAMVTAITSSLNHIPIKSSVAMTGEVTLYGEALPIGGLKEKLLAALRAGIKTVLIPVKNIKDLEDIPTDITSGLEIIAAQNINEVLKHSLESMPKLFVAQDKLDQNKLSQEPNKSNEATNKLKEKKSTKETGY